ncbi:MAG: hypothetical protein PHN55_10695, partial [Dysgonamonadaceae bacterium]|nr:hypothetical protein [Dysgonamonadaceae bacterium]
MKQFSRRNFIKNNLYAMGGLTISPSFTSFGINSSTFEAKKNTVDKRITIESVNSQFEREPLLSPFGFKGGYLSELWQTVSYLKSTSNNHSIGLGTQSVLWSDSTIFSTNSESGGNALMYTLTERALQLLKNKTFTSPIDVIDELLPQLHEYGKYVTNNPKLSKTFVLNALVSVDNALWLLYAKENGITNFDELIPQEYKSTFSEKHKKIAAVPLISYNVSPENIKKEADLGYFFMKIKIGQSGTQREMLEKDKKRLNEIHSVLKNIETPHTKNGKLPYYFDANQRYESKDTFLKFIDYADKIKAFDQIVLIEEPFPEDLKINVSDIPLRLASDESAHTELDTIERIELGYRAIALKPIAKTLSMTMKIAKAATDNSVPCLCADLTVNPILVEWNKNVGARLKSFPGLENLGLVESNGHQNYSNWEKMRSY